MAEKNLEDKIIKLDPLAKRLDAAGYRGGAGKLPKSYAKTLLKQAKPKIEKSLKKPDNAVELKQLGVSLTRLKKVLKS